MWEPANLVSVVTLYIAMMLTPMKIISIKTTT